MAMHPLSKNILSFEVCTSNQVAGAMKWNYLPEAATQILWCQARDGNPFLYVLPGIALLEKLDQRTSGKVKDGHGQLSFPMLVPDFLLPLHIWIQGTLRLIFRRVLMQIHINSKTAFVIILCSLRLEPTPSINYRG